MKPERIHRAQVEGDTDYLSAAGRKGAETVKKNRERIEAEDELLAEIAKEAEALEELERMSATNEHILTPDGEDPNERY